MRFPAVLLCCLSLQAQTFTQRGFIETGVFLFPREGRNDSARIVGESLLRYEAGWKPFAGLRFNAAFDARFDSHRQFERDLRLDFADRRVLRPALSLRRLSAVYSKSKWTIEAGRQLIRWGKADLLHPTDRFSARDFLNVFNSDFLGVTAARVTYEKGTNTIDAVYAPVFTPSRSPLLNQRWVILPPETQGLPVFDLGARYPGRGQAGLRWNHLGAGYEMSLSFYDGYNHLPLIDAALNPVPSPSLAFTRRFAHMRMSGADAAIPLRWFTLKGEGAWFTSRTQQADEYIQYVVQAERMAGEWVFVGGYAGEHVTRKRSPFDFAPDRGLTRTFLGRASYNLDANRSVAFESAVRQDGAGYYGKFEYSQALGQQWRATAAYTLIRGRENDFLGQYRRNSNLRFTLRYSF